MKTTGLLSQIAPVKPRAPTGDDAPRGNQDDALMAEANGGPAPPTMPLPAVPLPHNAMPSPFDLAPHTDPTRRLAFTLTPQLRSLILTTDQKMESNLEEKDGRVTLTLRWMAALAFLLLLPSCAGTSYEPCVSLTTADGKEVKACVVITPKDKEEKKEE